MIVVRDVESVGHDRAVEAILGRRVGPSTGTAFWAAFGLVAEESAAGEPGSLLSLICDGGERYAHNYYDDPWVAAQGWDLEPDRALVRSFLTTGAWTA